MSTRPTFFIIKKLSTRPTFFIIKKLSTRPTFFIIKKLNIRISEFPSYLESSSKDCKFAIMKRSASAAAPIDMGKQSLTATDDESPTATSKQSPVKGLLEVDWMTLVDRCDISGFPDEGQISEDDKIGLLGGTGINFVLTSGDEENIKEVSGMASVYDFNRKPPSDFPCEGPPIKEEDGELLKEFAVEFETKVLNELSHLEVHHESVTPFRFLLSYDGTYILVDIISNTW